MDMSKFGFHYTTGEWFTSVVASNGPITVVLDVIDDGLIIDADQTNVKTDHPNTAKIALAAARWHRRNQGAQS